MGLGRNIVLRLARTAYVKEALAAPVDLSILRRRPTKRVYVGVFLAALSYLIGWPVITLLGYLSVHLREPLILAIGGPVTYAVSHLTFLAGAWLAGKDYLPVLMRWSTRKAFEKLVGRGPDEAAPEGSTPDGPSDRKARDP